MICCCILNTINMHIYIYIYTQDTSWRNNKGRVTQFLEKYTSHFIWKVRKGYSRFYGERELETEQNCNILTPTLMAISVVSFSFSWCSTVGPGAHSAGFLYCILSPNGLVPKLHRGSRGLLLLGGGFPYHIFTPNRLTSNSLTSCLTELYNSSIAHTIAHSIFGMTCLIVMQFRGHSLPVHQSMSVSWAFTLSHFVSQIRLRVFFRLLAIGMYHFLLVHHFGMACLAGSEVNIQQCHKTQPKKIIYIQYIWMMMTEHYIIYDS